MHFQRIVDAGIMHRCMHRLDRFLDLRLAADFLGHEIAGVGDADVEPLVVSSICSGAGALSTSLRAKTVRCGSTPSVPPDMTKAIFFPTSPAAA